MKDLKIGDWYYRMMGYGGSASQWVCIRRKTNQQTARGMMSLFGGKDGGIRNLPVSDIYEAVGEDGVVYKVSANNLADNGHIGIGTLENPQYGHVCGIMREDARVLVEAGLFTEEEITAEFPFAFKDYDEEADANAGKTAPMTDGQEKLLRAAHEENEKRREAKEMEETAKFTAAVAEAEKELGYIPCKKVPGKGWLSCGEKRRNVAAVLKHKFPGVKFSVRTRNGSMSDSVTVEYEDGPARADVEKVVNLFEITKYNAYEDCHEPVSTAYSEVCGGFDYAFVERRYSEDVLGFVSGWILANVGEATEEFANSTAAKVAAKTAFPVGGYELVGMDLENGEWGLVVKAKGEPPKGTPPDAPNGATVTENKAKGGIEVRFPSIPPEEVRNFLKGHDFRWSKFGKCWWHKDTEEARAAADSVVAMWNDENRGGGGGVSPAHGITRQGQGERNA